MTFIAVVASRHPVRQRSALAHEFSHVVHCDDGLVLREGEGCRRLAPERLADAFARHLLVPCAAILQITGAVADGLKKAWMPIWTPDLAMRYGWGDSCAALQSGSRPHAPIALAPCQGR
ncbi:ImmA/IrrE family metallo-endopeptidase [Actinomyces israelii]|uniref:ImmA/IrrE family metallo-endopeptidase n=1 Tax=Actinomyces israelii TaxID=1659 RepID=A0ABT4I672_9ACTO|nr:ImmA/IrrE family metallo-endopeptidase [Actinomyces israelii]MCZ0856879.1 ImmA/IrrE family metallo-endopeptidase [Actinomyces israelii]